MPPTETVTVPRSRGGDSRWSRSAKTCGANDRGKSARQPPERIASLRAASRAFGSSRAPVRRQPDAQHRSVPSRTPSAKVAFFERRAAPRDHHSEQVSDDPAHSHRAPPTPRHRPHPSRTTAPPTPPSPSTTTPALTHPPTRPRHTCKFRRRNSAGVVAGVVRAPETAFAPRAQPPSLRRPDGYRATRDEHHAQIEARDSPSR
jgi:hypothetical protein